MRKSLFAVAVGAPLVQAGRCAARVHFTGAPLGRAGRDERQKGESRATKKWPMTAGEFAEHLFRMLPKRPPVTEGCRILMLASGLTRAIRHAFQPQRELNLPWQYRSGIVRNQLVAILIHKRRHLSES